MHVLRNHIFSFCLTQGFGAAYDCKWSPNDHSFSVTDSHGHLMRFGLGKNSRLTEDKV